MRRLALVVPFLLTSAAADAAPKKKAKPSAKADAKKKKKAAAASLPKAAAPNVCPDEWVALELAIASAVIPYSGPDGGKLTKFRAEIEVRMEVLACHATYGDIVLNMKADPTDLY